MGNSAYKREEARLFNEERSRRVAEEKRIAQDKIDNPEKYKRKPRKRISRKASAFGLITSTMGNMDSTFYIRSNQPTKTFSVPYGKRNKAFDKDPVLVSTWDELSKVVAEVPGYWLRITPEEGSGWIVPDGYSDEEDESGKGDDFRSEYLSTHTFYGLNYKHSTELLQRYGFNVLIDNWDK